MSALRRPLLLLPCDLAARAAGEENGRTGADGDENVAGADNVGSGGGGDDGNGDDDEGAAAGRVGGSNLGEAEGKEVGANDPSFGRSGDVIDGCTTDGLVADEDDDGIDEVAEEDDDGSKKLNRDAFTGSLVDGNVGGCDDGGNADAKCAKEKLVGLGAAVADAGNDDDEDDDEDDEEKENNDAAPNGGTDDGCFEPKTEAGTAVKCDGGTTGLIGCGPSTLPHP